MAQVSSVSRDTAGRSTRPPGWLTWTGGGAALQKRRTGDTHRLGPPRALRDQEGHSHEPSEPCLGGELPAWNRR